MHGTTLLYAVATGVLASGALAQQAASPRVRADSPGRDSSRAAVSGPGDATRLSAAMRELMRLEAQVRGELMAARAAGEAERMNALARRLQALTAQRFAAGSELALFCAAEVPVTAESAGWLGVTFADHAVREVRVDDDGAVRVARYRFAPAPTVEHVAARSPAAKAGVRDGDVLVAINGVTIGDDEIDLSAILRPGARVPLRLRRDGVERTVTVAVERRPPSAETPCVAREATLVPLDGDVVRSWAAAPTHAPSRAGQSAAPARPPVTFGLAAIGGAQLEPLDAERRELTGARSGVFVARVAPESPAATAGLRWGDVITKAGGVPVADFGGIREAMARAAGQPLTLEVMRLGRTRTVHLLGRVER